MARISSFPLRYTGNMAIFAHRDYRHLFAAQLVALFGTGLATVALGLLAYQLAGADAGAVLGTALAIKMVTYVVIAPIAGAYADQVPRRIFLVCLDSMRALVVLALPFVDQIWQIYVLIVVLQSASAAFTPTFQAALPDILPEEKDYTAALSASQLASTMESLLSPLLAAMALSVMSFHWLFAGTSMGFVCSAILVCTSRIPNATRAYVSGAFDRTIAGLREYLRTPELRGVLGLNLVVAAVGSVVMVNTVNYVQDTLGRSQPSVAILLAANGIGTIVAAVMLPKLINRYADRNIMFAGGGILLIAIVGLVLLPQGWSTALASWGIIGVGTGLVLTPTGRLLRHAKDRSAIFAAQFSLSHFCWLIAYPIAGWFATELGFTATWSILGGLATLGLVSAAFAWQPRRILVG
jgi:MFS family permease